VTGTPGTGKTSLCSSLASRSGMKHIELGTLIKEKQLHSGRDEEFDTLILDEDKVCDELEDILSEGNNIVDFHTCDFFPERWFQLIVVLRTDNTILYPRLEKRGYSLKKLTENIECEIMQVVLDEATESYQHGIVWELQNNDIQDMDSNIEKILTWIEERNSS